jgi:A/G-specific adenine glycosylase
VRTSKRTKPVVVAPKDSSVSSHESLIRSLIPWFRRSARDLPWRDRPLGIKRDPYRVLVSETMAQQTQIARVAERFETFMTAFPTVEALACAHEDRVLEQWSGLGYYQRARRLQAAARVVADELGGQWPTTPESLAQLPGVGRYTAGAVASLAFGVRTPLADGNVARVLLRVHGKQGMLNDAVTMKWVWEQASVLVEHVPRATRGGVALLNEGLMELGATVCTPRQTECDSCPLRAHCVAYRDGLADQIPAPKKATIKRQLFCASLLVDDAKGRVLIERRPTTGLWAGLWQAPTIESDEPLAEGEVQKRLGLLRPPESLGGFPFATTHRDVVFEVWGVEARGLASNQTKAGRLWVSHKELGRFGLSTPQRRILMGSASEGEWAESPVKQARGR